MNTSAALPFRFLTLSSLCAQHQMEEIDKSWLYLSMTSATSCKADVSHADVFDKHVPAEDHSAGRIRDRGSQNRKDCGSSTPDKLDTCEARLLVIIDGCMMQRYTLVTGHTHLVEKYLKCDIILARVWCSYLNASNTATETVESLNICF